MTTQHTPGPWRLGQLHQDGSRAIHAGTASIVRMTPFNSSLRSFDANARLIAAAPETAAERDRLRASNAELLKVLETVRVRLGITAEFAPLGIALELAPIIDAAIARAKAE